MYLLQILFVAIIASPPFITICPELHHNSDSCLVKITAQNKQEVNKFK